MARPMVARSSRETPQLVADLAGQLGAALRGLFDPYRPELHYMRGPGPKWHAKHEAPQVGGFGSLPALVPIRVKR